MNELLHYIKGNLDERPIYVSRTRLYTLNLFCFPDQELTFYLLPEHVLVSILTVLSSEAKFS